MSISSTQSEVKSPLGQHIVSPMSASDNRSASRIGSDTKVEAFKDPSEFGSVFREAAIRMSFMASKLVSLLAISVEV